MYSVVNGEDVELAMPMAAFEPDPGDPEIREEDNTSRLHFFRTVSCDSGNNQYDECEEDSKSVNEARDLAREKFRWLTNRAPVALSRADVVPSSQQSSQRPSLIEDGLNIDSANVPPVTPAHLKDHRLAKPGTYRSAARYLSACSKYSLQPNGGVLLGLSLGLDMLEVDGVLTNLELVPLCAAMLDAPFIKHLKLNGHPLQDTGAAVLALALPGCPWITELELVNCKITGAGTKLICDTLPKSGVHRLVLKGNLLRQNSSTGNLGLAHVTATAKNLTTLDLQTCGLASEGMRLIKQAQLDRAKLGYPECRVYFEGNFVLVEVLNSVTHGACALICIEAWRRLHMLIVRLCHFESRFAVTLYIASMMAMFSGSTLYHSMFAVTELSWFFMIVDHCAIYFLIAGTYTPVLVMGCRDPDTNSIYGAVHVIIAIYWIIVVAGIVMEHLFSAAKPLWYSKFILTMYLLLGFGGVPYFTTCPIVKQADVMSWIELGGLTYVCGIVFFLLDKRYPAMHVIWHLLVSLGAFFHFVGIWNLTSEVLSDPNRACRSANDLPGLSAVIDPWDGQDVDQRQLMSITRQL